jgi:hypothetical protein
LRVQIKVEGFLRVGDLNPQLRLPVVNRRQQFHPVARQTAFDFLGRGILFDDRFVGFLARCENLAGMKPTVG